MANLFLRTPLLWLATAASVYADPSGGLNSAPQALKNLIADRLATVQHWDNQAGIQVTLTIAVIVFGALVTILQGMNKGWCKGATLALGAGVSILTGITTKV